MADIDLSDYLPRLKGPDRYFHSLPRLMPDPIEIPPPPPPPPEPVDLRPRDSLGRVAIPAERGKRFTEEEEDQIWAALIQNDMDTGLACEQLKKKGIEISRRGMERRVAKIANRILEQQNFPKAVLAHQKILNMEMDSESSNLKVLERAAEYSIDQVRGKPKQRVQHGGRVRLDLAAAMADDEEPPDEQPGEQMEDGEWS
jgi:hypothetical protein